MEQYKISLKATEKELVSLSVYNVGSQKCDSEYQWGPGIRDHYLIHYVISGKGMYTYSGGQSVSLEAGDAFLVYPNTEVIYTADKDEPWEYIWVGFTGSDAAMILRATDFTKDAPFLKGIPYGNSVHNQIMHILEAFGNSFENAVEMTGRLYTTLAVFMHGAEKSKVTNTANTYVQRAIEYITANYSYPITVENIADYVGISRSQLFRAFESVTTLSPKEYLTDFRIRQACYLLETTDLSITAIANSIGFDNGLYFSKAFRNIKGLPPREYRAKYLSNKKGI